MVTPEFVKDNCDDIKAVIKKGMEIVWILKCFHLNEGANHNAYSSASIHLFPF
jgi:hypothetical protein